MALVLTDNNFFEQKSKTEIGDILLYTAMNGHAMEARVIGHYSDGYPRTSQFDAVHSAQCSCYNSEDAESFETSSLINDV